MPPHQSISRPWHFGRCSLDCRLPSRVIDNELTIGAAHVKDNARKRCAGRVVRIDDNITYSTDETSFILLNYKIDNALRSTVAKYKLFFRSNERNRKFESYSLTLYTEPMIDLGILSARGEIYFLFRRRNYIVISLHFKNNFATFLTVVSFCITILPSERLEG